MNYLLTEEELKQLDQRKTAAVICDAVNAFSPAVSMPAAEAQAAIRERTVWLFKKHNVAVDLVEMAITQSSEECQRDAPTVAREVRAKAEEKDKMLQALFPKRRKWILW